MGCPEPLASGPRKGQQCGKPCKEGEDRCPRHSTSRPDTALQLKRGRNQASFLAALPLAGGNISEAARLCDMARSDHYDWMAEDPAYPPRFHDAMQEATDVLVAEVHRRGFEGVQEPVVWQGKLATQTFTTEEGDTLTVPLTVRKYSDPLAMFLLKQRDPTFRDGPRTLVTAASGFDAQGNPWSGVQVGEEGEALAESFGSFRDALDVESTEAE